jgi:hypothetical protein
MEASSVKVFYRFGLLSKIVATDENPGSLFIASLSNVAYSTAVKYGTEVYSRRFPGRSINVGDLTI